MGRKTGFKTAGVIAKDLSGEDIDVKEEVAASVCLYSSKSARIF